MSYGVNIGMKNILCELFNQDVIWENDPWHVWAKSRGMKNCSTRHAHIDGAFIELYCTWMLLKATIDSL